MPNFLRNAKNAKTIKIKRGCKSLEDVNKNEKNKYVYVVIKKQYK